MLCLALMYMFKMKGQASQCTPRQLLDVINIFEKALSPVTPLPTPESARSGRLGSVFETHVEQVPMLAVEQSRYYVARFGCRLQ